jgi:SNW domain-containing protein 1
MGQSKKSSTNTLALQIDSDGRVRYDAIAKQGHGKDKVVHSKFNELLPAEIKSGLDPDLARPDEEEVQQVTEKTKAALEKVVNSKIAAAMPTHVPEQSSGAQYIRYTPAQQGTDFNSGAKQRVIRVVEAQQDPMEPPKFKVNKKIPRGPPSPPAPVMHSPPRKVTVKEQQEWKIPPCISNWKNARVRLCLLSSVIGLVSYSGPLYM